MAVLFSIAPTISFFKISDPPSYSPSSYSSLIYLSVPFSLPLSAGKALSSHSPVNSSSSLHNTRKTTIQLHTHSLTNKLMLVKWKAYRLTHIHTLRGFKHEHWVATLITWAVGVSLPAMSTVGAEIFNKPVTARTPCLNLELMTHTHTQTQISGGCHLRLSWNGVMRQCQTVSIHLRPGLYLQTYV